MKVETIKIRKKYYFQLDYRLKVKSRVEPFFPSTFIYTNYYIYIYNVIFNNI